MNTKKNNIQATMQDGRKWWVQTKYNVWSPNGQKFEKGIYPQSSAFEIGGSRIILPNGETTFLFWSDIEKTFPE
jgi:hypothetical protein